MTANQYKKKYNGIKKDLNNLESEVIKRLQQLCKQYPDVIVANVNNVDIKAIGIANTMYLTRIPTEKNIMFIDIIEKHIESTLPQQLKIPFN
jgi:hypothetical protein